ncbi:hypothetical protein GCM10023196_081110 [Actinoallomurus vinaceus]|uniref:Exonuclease domain-containing protein n=1 Tax=Actinoallomurus vinaceus TaxID=1080074 RepID=A0ABP8UMG8_9ACTN
MSHATTTGDLLALAGAVRALRRPASRSREREQVPRWARRLLTDDLVLVVDVETTGLENAYAVQIAAVDRRGALVFNEYVQPNAVIEPAALGARQARGVPRSR